MIYGLGHSTLSIPDFVDVCKTAGVTTIIDTRSHPGSRNVPDYNREAMESWLPENQINYEWWPQLGGWSDRHINLADRFANYDVDVKAYCNNAFPKQRIAKSRKVPEGEHGFTCWGFYDYQFFMMLDEFLSGTKELIKRGKSDSIACICCEACWTRCHRGMIADYLAHINIEFSHIQYRFRKILKPRTVVKCSNHIVGDRILRYHNDVRKTWSEENGR